MGFRDEVPSDGQGGWTDQGGNDFRHMPLGRQVLCGVPFKIIDPAQNGGKSCIVLRGGERLTMPDAVTVPVNAAGAALVFLHTLAWGDDQAVAHYVVHYADGQTTDVVIRPGTEILGWWGDQESATVKLAVRSANLASRHVAVQAWAWTNPRPAAVIASLEMRSTAGKGVPIIVAVTLLDTVPQLTSARPAVTVPPAGFVVIEAEKFVSFNVPPSVEPKDPASKAAGKKTHGIWNDAQFSGGASLEVHPGDIAAATAAIPQPEWLRDNCLRLEYAFTADQAAPYVLWARVGPANVYSPFRWRVDAGEWGEVKRSDPFLDMWEMGFWATMGWIRLGERPLTAGAHTLQIEVPRYGSGATGAAATTEAKMQDLEDDLGTRPAVPKTGHGKPTAEKVTETWGMLADCFVATRVPFTPHGKLAPGEEINTIPWLDGQAHNGIADYSAQAIAPGGAREVMKLDGLWEMARDQEPIPSPVADDEAKLRGPLITLPPADALAWMGVMVPHVDTRPELGLLHRRWYRQYVSLPADLRGKRVSLHIGEANYTASVFVNGQLCGTHVGGYVPFDVDVTAALKPGAVNEIMIGIKGLAYYRKDYRPEIPWGFGVAFSRAMLAPGRTGWGRDNPTGLAGSVWLTTHGQVLGHDLFVQSKFAAQQVQSSLEVDNRSAQPFTGKVRFTVLDATSQAMVAHAGEAALSVAAGATATVQASGAATALTPWWPEQGKLYTLRAEVLDAAGQVVDSCSDQFGYREVTIRGKSLYINGKRFNFRNLETGGQDTMEQAWAQWRAYHCNSLRLPDEAWGRYWPAADHEHSVLRYMDEHGVPVRYESQINGMFIDVATDDARFWQYCTDHLKQFVKAYRNHPSILIWVAENELDLISNMGNDVTFKKNEAAMIAAAQALDPSRPLMGDGAGDLQGSTPICNWHYPETGPIADPNNTAAVSERAAKGVSALYPDNAFTFAELARHCATRPWDRQKPLFVGETYFYSGPVSWQAWIGGDEALAGRAAANVASAQYTSLLIDGYRWQDVAGFMMWVRADALPGRAVAQAMAPVAVRTRDRQAHRWGGEPFTCRVKVYNDTLDESPLQVSWSLRVGGQVADHGEAEEQLAAGENVERLLTIKAPAITTPQAAATLQFSVKRGGAVVYEEQVPLTLYPRTPAVAPLAAGVALGVYDPAGTLAPVLTRWGLKPEVVADLAAVATRSGVLVVGPNALGKDAARKLAAVQRFVAAGGRVLILEQDAAYPAGSLPFALAQAPADGTYAWPRGEHPALAGLAHDDLSVWGQDQVVFHRAFLRNSPWPLLVDASSKEGLNLAPVVETTWGKGQYVLSQLLIGHHLADDPMAEQMLARLLGYLGRPAVPGVRVVSFLTPGSHEAEALADTTVAYRTAKLEELDLQLAQADLLVLPGSEVAMRALKGAATALASFTARGGQVLVLGLAPGADASLAQVVGAPLIFRPVGQERITVTARTSPLLAGIGNEDFAWYHQMSEDNARMIGFLFGDLPLAEGVFSRALVASNVTALTGERAISNGLTADDCWSYISYRGNEPLKLDWGQEFPISKVRVQVNKHYLRIDELTLTFADDPGHPQVLAVPDGRGPVEFAFPPHAARGLTLTPSKVTTLKAGPMGWDEVEILRELPAGYDQKVQPLTTPAGLVRFPAARIVLDLMAFPDPRSERVLLQLLHNLGALRSQAAADKAGPENLLPPASDDVNKKPSKKGDGDLLDIGM